MATSLSLINTIIESIGDNFFKYVDKIENEVVQLIFYKADPKVRIKSSKILPHLLLLINNKDLKIQKGKYYISLLISAIQKKTMNQACEIFFLYLKEVIENSGQIINKKELNKLFDKIQIFFKFKNKKK